MIEYTYELCKSIDEITYTELTSAVYEDILYRTLDWMGCVIGAGKKDCSLKAMKLISEFGGNEQSTVIGMNKKSSVLNAAFYNGLIGHKLEYDDINKISLSHPAAVIIPAVLAVSEMNQLTFGEFALGVACGYEVLARLGSTLSPSHYNYWHTTGSCGCIAAAAAVGKVLRLDIKQIQTAIGLAATMASGLVCSFGTDAKLLNVGNAASRGVLAALMAKEGFTAPLNVIDMKMGYAEATSKADDFSFLVRRPGDPLLIMDSHYKRYASCGHTHSALDALFAVMEEYPFTSHDVEKIVVTSYKKAIELTGTFKNETESQAKFSMPYCLSAAIVLGQVDLHAFSAEALSNQDIIELQKKICFKEDPLSTSLYPNKRMQGVTVYLKDKVLSKVVELSSGHPPKDFLEKKFVSLASMTISPDSAREIMHCILSAHSKHYITYLGDLLRRKVIYGM